jgi:DNA-binding LytR/AlgR family response regulator
VPRNFRQIEARKLDRFLLLDPAEILYFYMDHGIVRARTRRQSVGQLSIERSGAGIK